jgi:hypothetical protein
MNLPRNADHNRMRVRPAEDCGEKILEVDRWLDAADVVLMNALGGGGYSLELAAEHALTAHGRIRKLLGAAVVGAVV